MSKTMEKKSRNKHRYKNFVLKIVFQITGKKLII